MNQDVVKTVFDFTLPCMRCEEAVKPIVYWQRLADKRKSIRADCPSCHRYIKYLKQSPVTRALADQGGVLA